MKIILIFVVIFFVFLAFFGNTETTISNPFIAYVFFVLKKLVEYFPYFLIIFCILFLFLIRPFLSRKHLNLKIIFHTLLQIFSIFIIGVISSFLIIYTIAFIELNIFSVLINQNPKVLGIKTNINEIAKSIESNNKPPLIITNDKDSENEVIAIAKASSGTNNFFGNKIIPGIPGFLILPVKNNANLLLLDNTLVVKKIDEKDMQIISPLIGYLIIKSYFPSRYIKSNPKVTVSNTNKYISFRQNDAKNKLIKVDLELAKLDKAISSLSAEIAIDTRSIEESKLIQEEILSKRDKEYNACLSEGSYQSKIFVPKNSKESCEQIIKSSEEIFIKTVSQQKDLKNILSSKQNKLSDYKFLYEFFDAQKKIIAISENNVPFELGVFEPPADLRLVVNNTSSTSIADYFNTLSHEYLHFASYTGNKKLNGSFFEEALTEYFAKRAIESSLNTKTNQGYPVLVKIIEEISKKISEPDLADIYFNKEQTGLEEKMNLVYGENFYKNNIVLFESLLYASNSNEALQIANSIMRKIDGNELKKEDLFSQESKI